MPKKPFLFCIVFSLVFCADLLLFDIRYGRIKLLHKSKYAPIETACVFRLKHRLFPRIVFIGVNLLCSNKTGLCVFVRSFRLGLRIFYRREGE